MDGKAILAAILRQADAGVRANVRREDPLLYRDLRSRMFYFDDLMLTGDSSLAMIFTAAPIDVSALALRFASPALRERVLGAVSPGRARALRDAPAKRNGLDSVEAAQKKVLSVALQLQAAGRILIDPNEPDLA
jgi:flagellar motor switch protein FliG